LRAGPAVCAELDVLVEKVHFAGFGACCSGAFEHCRDRAINDAVFSVRADYADDLFAHIFSHP